MSKGKGEIMEGEIFRTEDDATGVLTPAGQLDAKGIEMFAESMKTETGKYGEFYILTGKSLDDEREINLAFSSKKLKRLIDTHYERIMNCNIKIMGKGEKFSREYEVMLL